MPGREQDPHSPERDWTRISRFFREESRQDDFFTIDDRTWADLDMDSVFSAVDRTCSSVGQALLYDMMRTPLSSRQHFETREAKIRRFMENGAERTRVRRILSRLGFQHGGELYAFLCFARGSIGNKMRFVFPLLGAAALASIVLAVILGVKALPVLAAVVVANFIIHFSYKAQVEVEAPYYGYLHSLLAAARRLSRLRVPAIREEAETLKALLPAFGKLERSTLFVPVNHGLSGDMFAMFFDLFKIVFLLEVSSYFFSHNRLAQLSSELKSAYAAVGTVDALTAVAQLRTGLSCCATPVMAEKARVLEAEAVIHPLVAEAVPNSITMDGMGVIVTGSNMSGKSTFLRTLGVNQILAITLCFTFAERFRTSFLIPIASIATRDNILKAESHYLSEARRMREIVRAAQGGPALLVIIDEILSGTNSKERIAASIRILRFLARRGCLVAAATHDRDIGLALADVYTNVHFTHLVNGSEIEFDFTLRPGIVEEGNAVKLLKWLEFPKEITDGLGE